MKNIKTPPTDDYEIRCPRLGHQIYFSYCRQENQGQPCFKTLDCWHTHFNVQAFLKAELTEEQWERSFCGNVKPKILSLLELIEQAKKQKQEK
ncbi:MAG: hypothetical protein GY697_02465 [Desulfobacterales bacterium]|nr:hypothetical protein [Desulfobacterales bacterium]